MSQLVGKWKLDRSENFEEFLMAIDVGAIQRKVMSKVSPVTEITNDDQGNWKIEISTAIKTNVSTFKLGEVFDDCSPSGGTRKAIASLEGDTLVVNPHEDPEGATITREIVDGELVMTLAKGGAIAKRFFKKA
ncbi:fatty acid-binding protein, muscle-like [Saccoglossus kowalevskii]|uniref:Fatty acid-binding protein, muscle-like n=1 Tax=Saccoglossus kowalevskii TaxID=10224 RepID=A0ABM0MJP8_SACKO|nr:PREDICTED: fatty acid-binding protein, muscle-like [Saccoglossus kowalevskii]